MREAIAGSFESCDCLIMIKEYEQLSIDIESIVFDQFGEQIKKVIIEVLKEWKIENLYVKCLDKGAYDYTIRARLITALRRLYDES